MPVRPRPAPVSGGACPALPYPRPWVDDSDGGTAVQAPPGARAAAGPATRPLPRASPASYRPAGVAMAAARPGRPATDRPAAGMAPPAAAAAVMAVKIAGAGAAVRGGRGGEGDLGDPGRRGGACGGEREGERERGREGGRERERESGVRGVRCLWSPARVVHIASVSPRGAPVSVGQHHGHEPLPQPLQRRRRPAPAGLRARVKGAWRAGAALLDIWRLAPQIRQIRSIIFIRMVSSRETVDR